MARNLVEENEEKRQRKIRWRFEHILDEPEFEWGLWRSKTSTVSCLCPRHPTCSFCFLCLKISVVCTVETCTVLPSCHIFRAICEKKERQQFRSFRCCLKYMSSQHFVGDRGDERKCQRRQVEPRRRQILQSGFRWGAPWSERESTEPWRCLLVEPVDRRSLRGVRNVVVAVVGHERERTSSGAQGVRDPERSSENVFNRKVLLDMDLVVIWENMTLPVKEYEQYPEFWQKRHAHVMEANRGAFKFSRRRKQWSFWAIDAKTDSSTNHTWRKECTRATARRRHHTFVGRMMSGGAWSRNCFSMILCM